MGEEVVFVIYVYMCQCVLMPAPCNFWEGRCALCIIVWFDGQLWAVDLSVLYFWNRPAVWIFYFLNVANNWEPW